MPEKNSLSPLGRKIFLDRYAVKDVKKETLAVGDLVVAVSNSATGQREIGNVIIQKAVADPHIRDPAQSLLYVYHLLIHRFPGI